MIDPWPWLSMSASIRLFGWPFVVHRRPMHTWPPTVRNPGTRARARWKRERRAGLAR